MIELYSKNRCKNCDIVEQMFKKYEIDYKVTKYSNMSFVAKELENTVYEEEIYYKNSFPIVIDPINKLLLDFNEILERYEEPLLKLNPNVFSMYPITYPDIYEMYKKARASYWQPEEISLINDIKDWEKLNDDEQHFVKYILAFFSASDGIVNENIDTNFSKAVQVQEARAFYAFQEAMESVHSETYSILLDKFIKNPEEKIKLQSGIQTIPSIKQKADWCFKYMHKDLSFQRRLIGYKDGAWMVNPASFECYDTVDCNEVELVLCHLPAKILGPENDMLHNSAPEVDLDYMFSGHDASSDSRSWTQWTLRTPASPASPKKNC